MTFKGSLSKFLARLVGTNIKNTYNYLQAKGFLIVFVHQFFNHFSLYFDNYFPYGSIRYVGEVFNAIVEKNCVMNSRPRNKKLNARCQYNKTFF